MPRESRIPLVLPLIGRRPTARLTPEDWSLILPQPPQYVDDEGDVLFYKDAYGRGSRKVVMPDQPSDSGIDVSEK